MHGVVTCCHRQYQANIIKDISGYCGWNGKPVECVMSKERMNHEQVNEPEYERRLAQAIKKCKTWGEIDALRMEVIRDRTTESLVAWQKRERSLRRGRAAFRRGEVRACPNAPQT